MGLPTRLRVRPKWPRRFSQALINDLALASPGQAQSCDTPYAANVGAVTDLGYSSLAMPALLDHDSALPTDKQLSFDAIDLDRDEESSGEPSLPVSLDERGFRELDLSGEGAATLRRLSMGAYLLGISGTTESTPLLLILLRLLFSIGLWFRVLAKCLLKKRLGKVNVRALTASAANGIAVAHLRPRYDKSSGSFRRMWIPRRTSARLESKGIMDESHRASKLCNPK